jgi:hypothetical protein
LWWNEYLKKFVYDLTHGAGLAIIHPVWMRYVLDEKTAPRFAQMARNVWNINEADEMTAAEKGIEAVRNFFNSLDMLARLSDVDIPGDHFEEMAQKDCIFGKTGSFKRLDVDDVVEILKRAIKSFFHVPSQEMDIWGPNCIS